jgi:membrane fusion protein (multidrug efflux system)
VFIIKIVNNRAQWVDVEKGLQSGDVTEVYGKLKPGDEVVKSGTEEIRDGSPIKQQAVKPDSTAKK